MLAWRIQSGKTTTTTMTARQRNNMDCVWFGVFAKERDSSYKAEPHCAVAATASIDELILCQ